MKFAQYLLPSLCLLACLSGCHKDKDEADSSLYFSGSLVFDYPKYVRGGEELTLTPGGVYTDNQPFGYYWKITNVTTANDTTRYAGDTVSDGHWTFSLPDSTATYSVMCYAYADGYYSTSYTASITVVDPTPGKSLTGTGIDASTPSFVDARDGKTYYYTQAGGLDWMRNSLGWEGAGVPYENCAIMSDVLGRFYSYDDALTACPDGWHLPTESDWSALGEDAGALMADIAFNGKQLWTYWPAVNITNALGLSILPAGYASQTRSAGAIFSGFGSYAAFWTADTEGDDAVYRYINENHSEIFRGRQDRSGFLLSVRCVR